MIEKIKNIKLSKTVRQLAKALLVAGLTVLTLSAVTFRQKAVVRGLEIQMDGGLQEQLIDRTYLKDILVKEFGSDLLNVPVEFIDINQVEQLYNDNPFVRKAEVFINKKGLLEVVVQPRTPLMRIMDAEKSFYLDELGVTMPLSKRYSARLPVIFLPVSAEKSLNEAKRRDLIKLVKAINEDIFMSALVDQIEIGSNGEYTILPLMGREKIRLGSTVNLEDKLNNIRLFYKKKIGRGQWNKCKIIDVRFEGQIVCDNNNT